MAGIEESKDVLTFVASLGEGVYESVKDGKLTLGDYRHFLPALGDVIPALSGIETVPEELADLTEAEIEELRIHFKTEFDIPDDLIEDFTETVINVGQNLFHLVMIYREWKER